MNQPPAPDVQATAPTQAAAPPATPPAGDDPAKT
jgi:hypothetical protein